ncbi:TPA: restriction endonuclease subunit S [Klebsiella aerogenes]|nr:restriction endonuclease subunit S [Klebsiella aerogenes]
MVPKDWAVLKFNDLVKSTQLGTVERGTNEIDDTKSIPLIKMGNLGWGSLNFHKLEYIEQSRVDDSLLLKKGDFLFNTRNTPELVGKSAVWSEEYPATFDNNINRIEFKKNVKTEYLCYYLNYGSGKSIIQSLPAGSTSVAAIYWKDLKNIKIVLPSFHEQKKIAQILSTWDKAITTTEQLLANSQQQKKALMQQLLTGKKRLLDKNGVRFSGEWESYELGDWIREYNEKSVSSDQHEVLTSSRGGLVKQSEYFADSRISQRDNIGFNVIPPGYITYRSRSDDGQFFFNRNELSFTGIISTYYPVFHFPEGDSTFFLNYLNRSSSAFAGYSVGTSQKVLSLNALKAIKARLPKKEEQQKIAALLSTADQEISAFQQKLDALKQEKKALMQQLLTGKRRVKIDNKEVA